MLEDLAQREVEAKDSEGKTYYMRARPYRTLNNVIDGVVITFNDITEQKLLARKSRENEEKWRGLVENAPMGIFIESDGRFAYINPFACELFGAESENAILNTPVLDRVHPDQYDLINRRNASLYKENKPLPAIEESWLRMDGGEVNVVVSAAPTIIDNKTCALVFVREKS